MAAFADGISRYSEEPPSSQSWDRVRRAAVDRVRRGADSRAEQRDGASYPGTPRVGQVLRTTRGEWTARIRSRTSTGGTGAREPAQPTRRTALGSRTPQQLVLVASGRRGLPDPLAGHRAQCRRPGNRDVQPDERRHRGQPVNTTEPSISGTPGSAVGSRPTAASGPATRRSRTRSSGFAATTRATTAVRSRVRTTRATRCAMPTPAGPFVSVSSRGTTAARRRPSRTRLVSWIEPAAAAPERVDSGARS